MEQLEILIKLKIGDGGVGPERWARGIVEYGLLDKVVWSTFRN